MGRIQEKKKEKKRKLLEAAFELFTTKGFQDTSILNITMKAGMAKGTFYLYFKDKEDVRKQLISIKSSELFKAADKALSQTNLTDFEEKLLFILDYVLEQLQDDPDFLDFMAKNLGWGVFKSALLHPDTENALDFYTVYERMLEDSPYQYKNPEVLLFMIIELVGSSCHSVILYKEPMSMTEYKPFLHQAVRDIIRGQIITP